ncbi:SpaA isopeptide-forming pilin-related protein [Xylanimonas cellulosilytica]|uniref:SpaA isopeptide-forming pilin-related protein n=1 Tax=Xylanimonas cellulosilytica TaxID=186189 RepID=UPI00019BFE41|nr:SpaA isopeptide-forming pilin-related protein [Xylanimonas cellulosilytica]
MGTATPAGAAPVISATGDVPSLTVVGAATEGAAFQAFQVARYAGVGVAQGRPVSVALESATDSLRTVLAAQVVQQEDARNGFTPAPPVTADGLVDGLDPLAWVAEHWSSGGTDLWGNPAATDGPLAELAGWLADAVQADPGHFGLHTATRTGARTADGVARATFTGLPAGLYVLFPQGAATSGATVSAPMLVGTQIPVGGTLHDLYAADGTVARTLGVVHVKGDAVTVSKSITGDGSPTFAGGDAVPMTIATRLPHFGRFDPTVPVRFEITDTHSAGLGEPDWAGTDARLADPVLTVGATTLGYEVGCDVGVANASDPCFGVVSTSSTTEGGSTTGGGSTDGGGSTGEGGGTWTVVLPDWVVRTHGGDVVILTYEQLLAPDLSSPTGGGTPGTRDTNRASVTFSHDPARPDATTTTGDAEIAVFTFPLHLTKQDAQSGTPLAGVEFAVSAGDVEHCFVRTDDGVYWHAGIAPCADTHDRPSTSSAGTLTVHGLAGNVTYTVAETKQADGYHASNLDTVRFTARAEPTFSPDRLTVTLLDYTYGSAGNVHRLERFLTADPVTTTIPTNAGNEHREHSTGRVTVLNWIAGAHSDTGGAINKLGFDARSAALAVMLLAASGAFFALAARRRSAETSTPVPEPAP